MSKIIEMPAELRSEQGTGASRRLRRAGKVPAVLYGGERKPAMLAVDHNFLILASEDDSFYTSLLEISADGKKQKAVLRDLQRHPFKRQIMHMDLMRIDDDHELHMHIPLHFLGEEQSAAGKAAGVVVQHQMIELEVICLPKDLPEFIEVDLSGLEPGQVVQLSDVKLPEGVRLAGDLDGDLPVVNAGHIRKGQGSGAAAPEVSEDAGEADEADADNSED
jgi:large subunit ribosomal protein L25